jgi:hypothetical protein
MAALRVDISFRYLKQFFLVLSLKLSIVPYAAGPDSRGHSKTAFANIPMSNCFPHFIVRWILNFVDQPSHENHENWYTMNKSDFTVSVLKILIARMIQIFKRNLL